jgi:hypothetical protein
MSFLENRMEAPMTTLCVAWESRAGGGSRVPCAAGTEPCACAPVQVITSLYNWWDFVPLNLWKQFQRRQNCYFLFISILQARG